MDKVKKEAKFPAKKRKYLLEMPPAPTAPVYPLQEVDVQLFALMRESFL